jgi:hypothetical protein
MDKAKIAEGRALLEKATPGEWGVADREVTSCPGFYPILIAHTARGQRGPDDAAFIAWAHNHLPELLDELERAVVLPCAIGTRVYENRIGDVEVAYGYCQSQLDTFARSFQLSDLPKWGKTVFLTPAAAEAAQQKGE